MRNNGFAIYAFLLLLLFLILPTSFAGDKKYPGEDDFVPCEKAAQIKTEVAPVYPEVARLGNVEGTVWIKALIDENGEVVEAKVCRCSNKGFGFEEAALEAAKQCEYTPATQNDKPVAVWVTYKVDFALTEGKEK